MFATPSQGAFAGIRQNDDRNVLEVGKWADLANPVQRDSWLPGALWAGSRFQGWASGWGIALDALCGPCCQWGVRLEASGGQQQRYIEGTTRDSGGSPLANAIVQVFQTSNDEYVSEVTSDNSGWFRVYTKYTGAHYLVAYKAGSPDVAGTTVNTLIPV